MVRHLAQIGGSKAYLKASNGLEECEVAIFHQLAGLKSCAVVSVSPMGWLHVAGGSGSHSLFAAAMNCSVMSVVTTASLVIVGGGGASLSMS